MQCEGLLIVFIHPITRKEMELLQQSKYHNHNADVITGVQISPAATKLQHSTDKTTTDLNRLRFLTN